MEKSTIKVTTSPRPDGIILYSIFKLHNTVDGSNQSIADFAASQEGKQGSVQFCYPVGITNRERSKLPGWSYGVEAGTIGTLTGAAPATTSSDVFADLALAAAATVAVAAAGYAAYKYFSNKIFSETELSDNALNGPLADIDPEPYTPPVEATSADAVEGVADSGTAAAADSSGMSVSALLDAIDSGAITDADIDTAIELLAAVLV